jgi:hypothetical protein
VVYLDISPESARNQREIREMIEEIIIKAKQRDKGSMMILRVDPSEEW